jgi:hypothetical protein
MGRHFRAAGVLEKGKAPLKAGPVHVPLRVSSERLALSSPERAVPFRELPTWAGRTIPKWTRWGLWNEDGTIFTPTRVI